MLVASMDTPRYARCVTISGNFAYVADSEIPNAGSDVIVVDITNPLSPQIVGSASTPGWAIDIALAGTYAFVADWTSGLEVLPAHCGAGQGAGADLYSVDVITDNMVRVNRETGEVTPLGYLGRDFYDTDLAYANGYIYLLNGWPSGYVELRKVRASDFQVVSAVTVSLNGQTPVSAEGLTSLGGNLLLSFAYNRPFSWSNAVGVVAESGDVTLLYDYTQFDPNADCDGLTTFPGGGLCWVDVEPDYRLINAGLPPNPSYTVLGTHPHRTINDLAFLGNGDLWGVDSEQRELVQLGPDGAVLRSVSHDPQYQLLGLLDLSSVVAVPEGGQEQGGAPGFRAVALEGRTRFDWRAEMPGRTNLAIFDISGRQVRTLLDSHLGEGDQTVVWDQRDSSGRMVAQGVYLARLLVGSSQSCVKTVILR